MISSTGDPKTATFFVCGEAPGKQELAQGIPFVGDSGRILWGTGGDVGLVRGDCFVTNVVQSAPLGASGNPTQRQIDEERARLWEEIVAFEGKVMILVGGIALKAITGWGSITNLRGYLLQPSDCKPIKTKQLIQVGIYKRDGKHGKKGDPKLARRIVEAPPVLPPNIEWIIAVLHPAGIRRNDMKTVPALKADLDRAVRASRGALDLHLRSDGDILAVDIETHKPPMDNVITMVAWAGLGQCSSQPYPTCREPLKAAMSKAKTIAYHNRAFDEPRLAKEGIPTPRGATVFDTMYAAQLLNPDLPKGLERAATMHLDLRPWKHLKATDESEYNRLDALVTASLALKQRAFIEESGQMPVFQAMMDGIPALIGMHERGIRVDPKRQSAWIKELETDLEEALNEWPYQGVSPTSPDQLKTFLYEFLEMDEQRDKYGKVTTDEAALGNLMRKYPEKKAFLEVILHIRKLGKDLKTYAKVTQEGGRVHPSYLVMDKDESKATYTQKGQGSGTGRPIARDPNIQNQTPTARRLYVPEPGWCLASLDWNQAEARYDQARSQDEKLLEAILLPGGVPSMIQKELDVTRVQAKGVYYGTRNLGGPRTIAWEMSRKGYAITPTQVQTIQRDMFSLFRKWAAHRELLISLGTKRGWIANAFGRRRYFYSRSQAPAMVGFDPQSGVADMLWRVLPLLDKLVTLLATIHDSVIIEAPEVSIEVDVGKAKAIMEQEFPEVAPGFKVPVSVKIGKPDESWGDMELRYKEEAA